MKILISGGRNYVNIAKIREALLIYKQDSYIGQDIVVIHGASKGADAIAGSVAKEFGFEVREFPAEWDKYGRSAGMKRNIMMLNESPDVLLAFHEDLSKSRGTKHCVDNAIMRGIPVIMHG